MKKHMNKNKRYLDSNIALIKQRDYNILPDRVLEFLEQWYSDGEAKIIRGKDNDGKEILTIENSNCIILASLHLYKDGYWTAWTSNMLM